MLSYILSSEKGKIIKMLQELHLVKEYKNMILKIKMV